MTRLQWILACALELQELCAGLRPFGPLAMEMAERLLETHPTLTPSDAVDRFLAHAMAAVD